MPAEWEPHDGTWLSWPKDPGTFPGDLLRRVEGTYLEIVKTLAEGEQVKVLVDDEKTEARVASMLAKTERVDFHRLKTVDVWVRDYGPIYVRGEGLALVKWKFNAWGGKYEDLLPDDAAGDRIAESTGLRVFRPGAVLEGGSVDVNGAGTVMTTEQCLLNRNRNPGLTRADVERLLSDYLGAKHVIWLKQGIEGDDTDGHVDDIARFVGPRRVLVASERNSSDPNGAALSEDLKLLEAASDQDGRPIDVVTVPMPPKVSTPEGRLPASHMNFYIGNRSVLVPVFGGETDREALKAMELAIHGREAVGIDCRALVYGLGTIHCVTQQVPAAKG